MPGRIWNNFKPAPRSSCSLQFVVCCAVARLIFSEKIRNLLDGFGKTWHYANRSKEHTMNRTIPTRPGRALFNLIESGHFDRDPEREPCPPDILHRIECARHERAEREAWEDSQADTWP